MEFKAGGVWEAVLGVCTSPELGAAALVLSDSSVLCLSGQTPPAQTRSRRWASEDTQHR